MPQFFKIVMGLGRKLSSQDKDFMACSSRFATLKDDNGTENLGGKQGTH
jgi:hypothetical protein